MIKTNTDLVIRVESLASFRKRVRSELEAIEQKKQKMFKEDSISFPTLDELRKFLTPKKLELIKAIRKHNPESIYELAKLVKRTPENVNTDIKLLEQYGFVYTTKTKDVRRKTTPKVDYEKLIVEIAV